MKLKRPQKNSTNPGDIEKARLLGIKHFLSKPLSHEDVKRAILDEWRPYRVSTFEINEGI